MRSLLGEPVTLDHHVWTHRRAIYIDRSEAALRGHSERRAAGIKDPIDDFLWVYLRLSARRLATWTPGAGVVAEGARSHDLPDPIVVDAASVWLDAPLWWARHGHKAIRIQEHLSATASRRPSWGCFGMHEWAMLYRTRGDRRHEHLPLRVSPAQIDAAVEAADLQCTHFDALRFFTERALPLNAHRITRADAASFDQPGCVHAGMELARAACQLWPMIPAELVLDAMLMARSARELDMQASPYDTRSVGLEPVEVETPPGRAEYVRRQRELAARAAEIRHRLIIAVGNIKAAGCGARRPT